MRLLALDWGTVRVGAAISDSGGKIAFPLDKPLDKKDSIRQIKEICLEQQVEKILIGSPVSLKGDPTESTALAQKYAESLKKELGLPVEFLDERLSSIAAQKILGEAGLNQQKQRSIKDNIAAQVMLQAYIDNNN